MHDGILALLADAGIRLGRSARGYRPSISLPGVEVKILKPQNVAQMLHTATRDCGFCGADWMAELFGHVPTTDGRTHAIGADANGTITGPTLPAMDHRTDIVELLDTGLDPVRIVVAVPRETLARYGGLPAAGQLGRPVRIAGEMERITRYWMARRGLRDGLDAEFVRTWGATEVFPPEDADAIVDITATGATLEANGLAIVDEIMRSSTRLYASAAACADAVRRTAIDDLVTLLRSVLDARGRVLMELNVAPDALEHVCDLLPCMRQPTISPLHHGGGYAVKAAVPRDALPLLIPRLRAAGGSDILVSPLQQVVP